MLFQWLLNFYRHIRSKPFLFVVLVLFLYFFPIFFQNQVFYYDDILLLLPLKKFFIHSISSGVFPLWNPFILSGYPFFADISAGTYYSPYLFLFLKPTMQGLSLLIVLHFFIAAFFMHKLAKLLGISTVGSLISSITFSLSGLLINYIVDPSRLFVVCLYPLFFYLLLKTLDKGKMIWLVLTSVVLASQIFAGHIQYVLIELSFTPFFLFIPSKIKIKKRIAYLLIIISMSVLLSSVILLPVWELLPFTARLDIYRNFSIYDGFSLKLPTLIRFFFAHFWGIKSQGSAWGIKDTSTVGYIGFLPLMLIFLNLNKLIQNRKSLLLTVCAILSLLISFGNNLPFFWIFVKIIPLFRLFRNPMAYLAFYTFTIALLTGFAADFFATIKEKRRLLRLGIFAIFISSLAIYILILLNNNFPYQILISLAGLLHKRISLFHTTLVDLIIAKFIITNIAIVAFLGFIALLFKKKEIFLLIITIDLIIFTRSNFFTINQQILNYNSPIAHFLKTNIGSYRYLSSSEIIPYSGTYNLFSTLSFQPPFSKEGEKLDKYNFHNKLVHELELIPPNFSMGYGIHTVDGLSAFIMKDYADLFTKTNQKNEVYQEFSKYNPYITQNNPDIALTRLDFSKISFNDELFDKLGVKYIVTDRNLYLSHHKKVLDLDNIAVYENLNVLPRVVIVNDSHQIIEKPDIINQDANRIIIKTLNKGSLVLRDINYPGWRAFVNGKEVTITPYEKIFRSVSLPQTKSTVEFSFEPLTFRYGAIISIVSWLLVSVYLIKNLFKKNV